MDLDNNLVAVTTGHIQDSFLAAVQVAESVFSVRVRNPADIVLAVIPPPKDINLYQAQNSLENAKLILKDGGILILVSPCREGIGPSAFYDLMSGFRTPREALDLVESDYKLGYHKAVRMAQILNRAEIWGVTDLPGFQLEAIFLRSFDSIQSAVNQAVQRLGRKATMAVLLNSDRIVPVVAE
jgi:nickel-dependent lactate racemase